MKKVFGVVSVLAVALFIVASCGKEDKRDTISDDQEIEEAQQGRSKTGKLNLIPGKYITKGLITYTMYENGLLTYEGYVTYLGGKWGPYKWSHEYTVPFRGKYKADPKSFRSETYDVIGDTHADFKLVMEVKEDNQGLKVIDVDVRESDAYGKFEIDVSEFFVDIVYAEAHLTVFNYYPVVIMAKK